MMALALIPFAWSLAQVDLRWPVGDGDHAFPLRATYGQLEGNKNGWNLHLGLDILGSVPLETVRAIEDGVVRRAAVTDEYGQYKGIVVESSAMPGHAFVYKHLVGISVGKGDVVKAGDPLGSIDLSNVTNDPHLHLSRVAGDFMNKDWYDIDTLSERNPLALLKKRDDLAPRVARNEVVSHVVLRSDDGEFIGSGAMSASSTSGNWKDIVVRTFDVDRLSWHLLAPYRLSLRVISGSQTTDFLPIRLDGALVQHDYEGLYSFKPLTSSNGSTQDRKYDYFFVLTNTGHGAGTNNAWLATPGTHTLHVEVEDVAGNITKIDQVIEIQ